MESYSWYINNFRKVATPISATTQIPININNNKARFALPLNELTSLYGICNESNDL